MTPASLVYTERSCAFTPPMVARAVAEHRPSGSFVREDHDWAIELLEAQRVFAAARRAPDAALLGDAIGDVLEERERVRPHRRRLLELAPVDDHRVVVDGRAARVEPDAVVHAVPVVALADEEDRGDVVRSERHLARARARLAHARERGAGDDRRHGDGPRGAPSAHVSGPSRDGAGASAGAGLVPCLAHSSAAGSTSTAASRQVTSPSTAATPRLRTATFDELTSAR